MAADTGAAGESSSTAGASRAEISRTNWSRGFPGVATVEWGGGAWRALDYGDRLDLEEEVARHTGQAEQPTEVRQCLLKASAAAALWVKRREILNHEQVLSQAAEMRAEHYWAACEAGCALGAAPAWVSPEEADLRVFVHDATEKDREKARWPRS